jgi:hypothetical protein
VILSGAALAVTTWLAWMVTVSKAEPALDVVLHPAGWPIHFSLPAALIPAETPDGFTCDLLADGSCGSVAFFPRTGGGEWELEVAFRVLEARVSAEAALYRLAGAGSESARVIPMGPMKGFLVEAPGAGAVRRLAVVGCTPEGLAVLVELRGAGIGLRQRRLVEAVCRSIRFAEWSVRP